MAETAIVDDVLDRLRERVADQFGGTRVDHIGPDIHDAIDEIILLRRLVGLADGMLAAGYESVGDLETVSTSPTLRAAHERAKNGRSGDPS